ncbi:MAG: helix-turn-helix transcriptional regulator [Bacteroidales bacterium]
MFGTKLRYLRKQLNISQQKLGEETGIPQTTISDWENNKYLPNINEAVKLAAALGVTLTELLEKSGDVKTA